MRDAAAQFLEQLAEMIVRLYVMKPLIESLLGPSGTIAGGGGGLGLFAGGAGGAISLIREMFL